MKTMFTLAFALWPFIAAASDPEQPYARSARPAQHHDTGERQQPGRPLFAGFKGSPGADACRTRMEGAPMLRYDALADRWLYTRPAADPANGMYYQCTAVSATPDINGPYHRYVFESRLANGRPAHNGAAALAVWPDAYYFSFVMDGAGSQACGYDRIAMLAGEAAEGRCVDFPPSSGRVLPAEMTGESVLVWRFSFTTHTIGAPFFVRAARVRTCTSG
jgi:hypothetical protein